MLRYHYHAPNRTATASQMAYAANFPHYGIANLHYGKLGRRHGELLDFYPTTMPIDVLVIQSNPDNKWIWTLRPEVAEAIEALEWVEETAFQRG